MNLKNKVTLVTGAGGLIGSTIAKKLATDGAILLLVDLNEEFLTGISNQFSDAGFDFACFAIDITDSDNVSNLFSEIESRYDRLDCLINNAGIQPPIGRFINNNLSDWYKNIEINLFAAVNFSHKALKLMVKNDFGRIINLAGGGATSSRPNLSAYAVAKTAIVRFTEVVAEEMKGTNITINAISPGAVNSKMLDEILRYEKDAEEEYKDALKRKKKGGTDPQLAAQLISFLCSDTAKGITGKLISAPWDPWTEVKFQTELCNEKDLATLRRIDNKTFYKKI